MESAWERGKKYVREQIYPVTFTHIVYLIVFTVISTYVTNYFLNFRVFKWLYFGSMALFTIVFFRQGEKGKAAGEVFRLATSA